MKLNELLFSIPVAMMYSNSFSNSCSSTLDLAIGIVGNVCEVGNL